MFALAIERHQGSRYLGTEIGVSMSWHGSTEHESVPLPFLCYGSLPLTCSFPKSESRAYCIPIACYLESSYFTDAWNRSCFNKARVILQHTTIRTCNVNTTKYHCRQPQILSFPYAQPECFMPIILSIFNALMSLALVVLLAQGDCESDVTALVKLLGILSITQQNHEISIEICVGQSLPSGNS